MSNIPTIKELCKLCNINTQTEYDQCQEKLLVAVWILANSINCGNSVESIIQETIREAEKELGYD